MEACSEHALPLGTNLNGQTLLCATFDLIQVAVSKSASPRGSSDKIVSTVSPVSCSVAETVFLFGLCIQKRKINLTDVPLLNHPFIFPITLN